MGRTSCRAERALCLDLSSMRRCCKSVTQSITWGLLKETSSGGARTETRPRMASSCNAIHDCVMGGTSCRTERALCLDLLFRVRRRVAEQHVLGLRRLHGRRRGTCKCKREWATNTPSATAGRLPGKQQRAGRKAPLHESRPADLRGTSFRSAGGPMMRSESEMSHKSSRLTS